MSTKNTMDTESSHDRIVQMEAWRDQNDSHWSYWNDKIVEMKAKVQEDND